ncbi:MAG: cobalt ABC transporter ATP-binding protein [Micrococcales bacterium]|nr:cobalt ABC transporter ATP-binding protein [Micrococcales bacterium]
MIRFDQVTFNYHDSLNPIVSNVNLEIPEGELALVVGHTGTGKSTLLNLVNGMAPHFTGGNLAGVVTVADRSTANYPPREMADLVGVVRQDPASGFVTDIVEDELAYTMESLAVPPNVMRRRVEETLDLLGLASLRSRPLRTLSGGERQRVAIGSVMTAHPSVLVLDEPTSALDPQAAEEVLAAIQRFVHDLGLTVLMSEHRLERVVQYADSVVTITNDGEVWRDSNPAHAMISAPVAPPVVELGRWAGWDPLPLSIRDARRDAVTLREDLTRRLVSEQTPAKPAKRPTPESVATISRVSVNRSNRVVLRSVDCEVSAGEVVALMGRNGSGKSTFLQLLAGSASPSAGKISVRGHDPTQLAGTELVTTVGLVPQEPALMLWADSVVEECASADQTSDLPQGTTLALFHRLRDDVDPQMHPRDLSEGTRLALVVALVAAASPDLLLLDEPTRGLDYSAKVTLTELLRELAVAGQAVIVATHDVELVAAACTRVLMIGDADIVLDAEASAAATASPVFAPQVAKVLTPLPFLTLAAVREAAESDPALPRNGGE